MNDKSTKKKFKFIVNDMERIVDAHPMARLLDVLRNDLNLMGSKEGCGEGECGACAIFCEGELVNSCLIPIAQVANQKIITIEGVAIGKKLHLVQKCFAECGAAQCGICTPGMVMASIYLLRKNQNPTFTEIQEGLAGNLCRCTGYTKIFDAVERARDFRDEA